MPIFDTPEYNTEGTEGTQGTQGTQDTQGTQGTSRALRGVAALGAPGQHVHLPVVTPAPRATLDPTRFPVEPAVQQVMTGLLRLQGVPLHVRELRGA